jgi:glycosyltransferase involved in cell wall biosynthesis
MKILMPYKADRGFNLSEDKVTGGIEKFISDVNNNFDVIPARRPLGHSKFNGKNRKQIMAEAIAKYNPDLIFLNSIELTRGMLRHGIPIVAIFHIGIEKGITLLSSLPALQMLTDEGHHIYFVSEHQYNFWNKHSKRLNHPFEIKGYINPSYVSNTNNVSDIKYDVATIGRCSTWKKPFLLHNKSKDNLSSLVITTAPNESSMQKELDYYQNNLNWSPPQTTIWDLPHTQVIKEISKASVYCSTCPDESYGITSLEALSQGLPIILLCDKTMNHASECIPASSTHYVKLSNKCSSDEFKEAVDSLQVLDRAEIADMTREKHSLENWERSIQTIFDNRLNDKNIHNLLNFF